METAVGIIAVLFTMLVLVGICAFLVWLYRDASRRYGSGLKALCWVVLVISTPVVGLLIYFLVRPSPAVLCEHCGAAIQPEFRICPYCRGEVTESRRRIAPKESNAGLAILLVGLLLVFCVPVTAIIAAIAIPNLIMARTAANEFAALANMRLIAEAQTAFHKAHGRFGTLEELGREAEFGKILLTRLAESEQSGYRYRMELKDGDYACYADPLEHGKDGRRHFLMDSSSAIWFTAEERPASKKDSLLPETGKKPNEALPGSKAGNKAGSHGK